ncbi:MAG: gluconeogenesis factor YvcK family protein, partial [Minisyncoccia bacterium]
GVLPPGDIRQCLVALSDSSNEMRKLMNYRFESGIFKGHSFGNLFLTVLEKINNNFLEAINQAGKILNIKGEIVPVTTSNVNLYMELKNGKILKGENEISLNKNILKTGIKKIYLKPQPKVNSNAVFKIKEANMIVIGPGNLYSSILPNLIIPEIKKAILESKAIVVYNCNLVNKKGQTDNFKLDDYVNIINSYLGKNRINFVTFNSHKPPEFLIKKYIKKGEKIVELGKVSKNKNYKIVLADLLDLKEYRPSKSDVLIKERSFIRHNADKLAKVLMLILEFKENQNILKNII